MHNSQAHTAFIIIIIIGYNRILVHGKILNCETDHWFISWVFMLISFFANSWYAMGMCICANLMSKWTINYELLLNTDRARQLQNATALDIECSISFHFIYVLFCFGTMNKCVNFNILQAVWSITMQWFSQYSAWIELKRMRQIC